MPQDTNVRLSLGEETMQNLERKPTSPGEILREEFLKPLGLSRSAFAKHIGCDVKVINRIVNGRSGISAEMALLLVGALQTTPDFWLNAQQAVDLYKALKRRRKTPESLIKIGIHGSRAA
jgi:antitoxin HigA-1